jgi:hypothetical protein
VERDRTPIINVSRTGTVTLWCSCADDGVLYFVRNAPARKIDYSNFGVDAAAQKQKVTLKLTSRKEYIKLWFEE